MSLINQSQDLLGVYSRGHAGKWQTCCFGELAAVLGGVISIQHMILPMNQRLTYSNWCITWLI